MKTTSGKEIERVESESLGDFVEENLDGAPHNQRFPLTVAFTFVLGTAETKRRDVRPQVHFKCEHLVSNVREPGVATLTRLQAANVSCLLEDGLDLCAQGDVDGKGVEDPILGVPVLFPWIGPANSYIVEVEYTGRIPIGHVYGSPFQVRVTLVGPATLV